MYAIPFGEIFHDLIFTTGVEWLCVYCFFFGSYTYEYIKKSNLIHNYIQTGGCLIKKSGPLYRKLVGMIRENSRFSNTTPIGVQGRYGKL